MRVVVAPASAAEMANYDQAIGKTLLQRGDAFYAKKNWEAARADYTQAVALDPKNALAWESKANTESVIGLFDDAIADYDRALRIDPQHARAYLNRGITYSNHDGFRAEAIADFQKVLAFKNDDDDSRSATDMLKKLAVH
jgi:tetratricopeptide (TPR) repeat protein